MNNVTLEKLRRVSVVGTSCSGKTTYAGKLAQILQTNHIEIDSIFWLPEWTERPTDEFRELVRKAASEENWVFDGNYTRTRDVVWERATTIIWLNYSFPRTYYRALKRTTRRALTGEEMWSGNRETVSKAFFSRDSILLWVLTSYFRKRRRYSRILFDEQAKGKELFIFQHPREAENFLQQVKRLRAN